MKKIYSILTLCLFLSAALVSCSDDEEMNKGNATVSFLTAEHSVKESKGIFNIPIIVTGDQNGPIEVNVEVSSNDANCKEDVHYLVTSKKLIIPANKKTVNVEIKSVDDRVINDDRHFSIHIASARGASVSSDHATANVTLRDNDDIPYERMAGKWTFTANNLDWDAPMSYDINFSVVYDESDPLYGSLITVQPWAIFNGDQPIFDDKGKCLVHPMTFHHDAKTGKTTVDMRMGTIMADEIDFGFDEETKTDLHQASIRSAIYGMAGFVYSGTITGEVNEDFTEIKFPEATILSFVIFNTNGAPYTPYGAFNNITFKLKN